MGRTSSQLNELSATFVAYAAGATAPVMDIGCAFGIAALAALASGAHVVAVDVCQEHLNAVLAQAPPGARHRLRLGLGWFPGGIDWRAGSLDAVHASNLLNFLRGQELEEGLRKIHGWLRPRGKVFVIAGTPYARNIRRFIPTYECRRQAGVRWPGECEDLGAFSEDPSVLELPSFLHLLDDQVLRRAFLDSGFRVETAKMFCRAGTPDYLRFDGRENVMLIASKP